MKRIQSLDLARGFTVLMIAPIHTVMLFSELSVRNTLPGALLAFIAEWQGAQILMTVMGISFSYSKNQAPEFVFKKAVWLAAIGYGLNIFKFIIPHLFGWLPQGLLGLLQTDPGMHGYTQLFLLGDILHFAAFSLIILLFISMFRSSEKIACWLAIVICFAAPLFWDANSDNSIINYALELLGGQPPRVFFPLLPWLVYPLLGLAIGKTIGQKETLVGFDSFWMPGFFLLILGLAIKYCIRDQGFSSFYRTAALDTLIHVGCVLMTLSAWHWISLLVKPNYLFRL